MDSSLSGRGYDGPGRYWHYKGGEYEVLGLAVREESKDAGWVTEVVYRPLTPGSLLDDREEAFWTRVLEDFNATVPCFRDDDCAMHSCGRCRGTGRQPRFRRAAS